MSFMEPQVTIKQTWYQVDTRNEGIVSFAAAEWSKDDISAMLEVDEDEITETVGFGARMSAPGYLDCTEWTVFDTAEEAEKYLAEEYGDDEDEAEAEDAEEHVCVSNAHLKCRICGKSTAETE